MRRLVETCVTARLSGFGGSLGEIIANEVGDGRRVVTIAPEDKGFGTTGCGDWRPVFEVTAPLSAIPEGTWLVGDEIPPGTYSAEGGDLCYWARLNGFSGELGDIIANNVGAGKQVAEIMSADAGFSSGGCGTWTRATSPDPIATTGPAPTTTNMPSPEPDTTTGPTATTTPKPSPEPAATTGPMPTATPRPEPAATTGPTPSTTSEPGFGDGTWIVGTDVGPGIYAAAGGTLCYWSRLSGFGGSLGEIIANEVGGGRTVVTIAPEDKGFETTGCGDWRPVFEVTAPLSAIPEGTWLVGDEIPPGTYSAEGGDLCYWARLNGFSGELGDIIANNVGAGKQVAEIMSADAGFSSGGCGTWTRATSPDPIATTGPAPTATPRPEPAATTGPTATTTSEPGFGDGTWIVGTDVAPGIYAAAGGSLCYWSRLSGFGGSLGEIIANEVSGGRTVVEIEPDDKGFETAGCGDWRPVPQVTAPLSAIPEGTWLAGDEIPAGTYAAEGGDACYWARLSGFSGELGDVIANNFGAGKQVVEIMSTDAGFSSGGCGAWTSVTGSEPAATTESTKTREPGFGDGTWIVGTDVPPGIYATAGGSLCYWSRLSGFGGSLGEIIANEVSGGRTVVEIEPDDQGFETNGCGDWRPASEVTAPLSDIPEGTWLVGDEVLAGTYATEGGDACYWTRLSGFGGELGDIIANNIGAGKQVVEIRSTDAGFSSRGCGAWSRAN